MTLRELMDERGLSRADVARALGLPVRHYSHGSVDAWLSGSRSMPACKLQLVELLTRPVPPSAAADSSAAV